MVGVARIVVAVAVATAGLCGCQTDGIVGAEVDAQAKARVIDTPKTLPRTASKSKQNATEATTAQGDRGGQVVALRSEREDPPSAGLTARPRPADAASIPAQSLFGNWTLAADNGGKKCSMILGGVLIGSAYSARGGADCPGNFAAVQTWEIQGDELILRNQSRAVVGRLQPTGPSRFDGQAQDVGAFYLVR
jgi:hypothetical protein